VAHVSVAFEPGHFVQFQTTRLDALIDNLHCESKFANGTLSRKRSTSVSLSHINPSKALLGRAVFSNFVDIVDGLSSTIDVCSKSLLGLKNY
jgi:hypothetical protein